MNFPDAIKSGFRNYVTCSGRASRSEYWYWTLFTVLVSLVLMGVDYALFHDTDGPIGIIFSLATFLPGFCIMIRRLHDVDRSGWWWLIGFTIIGIIFPLLVWHCTKGTIGDNRFGPDPLPHEG